MASARVRGSRGGIVLLLGCSSQTTSAPGDGGADAASVDMECDDFVYRNDPVWTGVEPPDPDYEGLQHISGLLKQGGSSAVDLKHEGTYACDYFKLADYLMTREVDVAAAYARLGRTGTHEWDGVEHQATAIFGTRLGSRPYTEITWTITGRIAGFIEASGAADALGNADLRRKYLHAAVRAALELDEGRDVMSAVPGQERRRYAREYRFRTTGVWPDLGADGRALDHANDLAWIGFVAVLRALYNETIGYGSPDPRWKTAATELIRDYLATLDCVTTGGTTACGYYPHEYRLTIEPDPARRDTNFLNATPCNGTAEVMNAVLLALGADDGGRGLDLDAVTRDAFREKLAQMLHSIDATKQGSAAGGYYWYQTERTGGAGGGYPGSYSVTAGGGSAGMAAILTATGVALSLPGTASYAGETATARDLAEGALAFVESKRIVDAETDGYRWHVIEGCDPSRDPDGAQACGATGTEWRAWLDDDYSLVGKCRGVMPIAQTLAQIAMMSDPGERPAYGEVVGGTVQFVDGLTRTFHERHVEGDGLPGLISPWSNAADEVPPRFPTHTENLRAAELLQQGECDAAPDGGACAYRDAARSLRLDLFRRAVAEMRCQDREEGKVDQFVRPRTNLTDCTPLDFVP